MKEPRNTFHYRETGKIENDNTFLRLFAPGVLEVLPADVLWSQPLLIQSAPGGGKTSLLRLFTPGPLRTLYNLRDREEFGELYQGMRKIGALEESGPNVLGVLLSGAQNYPSIEDVVQDQARRERSFFALLNARLALGLLRGVASIKELRFPDELGRIEILFPPHTTAAGDLPIPCKGSELFEWARTTEKRICDMLGSLAANVSDLPGHSTLDTLRVLTPGNVLVDGHPVAGRFLFLVDDAHKLTPTQRRALLDFITTDRPATSVWIAERLEALSTDELIGAGAEAGRDYAKPIRLEDYWRQPQHARRFEKLVTSIAERRAALVPDLDVGQFTDCIPDAWADQAHSTEITSALSTLEKRIRAKTEGTSKFDAALNHPDLKKESAYVRLVAWRTLEIYIDREGRRQRKLDLDLPIPEEEFEFDSSSVRAAAEVLLAQEFKFPYYFGITRLANLASSNIQQFLALAGELFEDVITKAIVRSHPVLPPERQEMILKRTARERWNNIARNVPNGRDVIAVLDAIRDICVSDFKRGTASYGAGGAVTGIGIEMNERGRLLELAFKSKRADYRRLVDALTACITNNLLEVSLDKAQGVPGRRWLILYLNRWLCLHFDLPPHYGGWRPRKSEEMAKWLPRTEPIHAKGALGR